MMIMKVLVVSDYRGTVSVRPEAEMFIGMAKAGVQVDILTYPETEYEADFRKAGMRVMTSHPKTKFNKQETRFLHDLLVKEQYQVLHLYNSRATIHGLKAARRLPVKVILYRGYAGHVHWYDPTAYFKYLHPRVDAIICITREIQRALQRQFWFRRDPTVWISKGHDPEWYKGIKPANLEPFGIPSGAFTVISVANNRPFKDIPTLLKVARAVSEQQNVYWLLVGNGMDTDTNLKLLAESPARDHIIFAGFQPNPLPLMRACQVIINTSTGGEGLNKTLIEGMSLGLAPVISDIPGNREVVPDTSKGEIVTPGDVAGFSQAIIRYVQDQGHREMKAREARSFIRKELHIAGSVRKTMDLYQKLLA